MSLPDEALSLAEILSDAGYRTGGFVGVRLLGPDSGASQGFGFYQQPVEERESPAEAVVQRALSWLDRAENSTDDPDGAFIFYWIAFNAAYATYDAEAMDAVDAFREDHGPQHAGNARGLVDAALVEALRKKYYFGKR